MIDIGFTLEDVGEPRLFISEVTRIRLSWIEEELLLLRDLLSVLESNRPHGEGRARALSTAKRLVARAAKRLEHVRENVRAALERKRDHVSWQSCGEPVEMKLAHGPRLGAARDRLAAVGEKLRLLLILFVVLRRTGTRMRREPIAQAKSAIQDARELLLKVEAVMERSFPGELHREHESRHGEPARRASC